MSNGSRLKAMPPRHGRASPRVNKKQEYTTSRSRAVAADTIAADTKMLDLARTGAVYRANPSEIGEEVAIMAPSGRDATLHPGTTPPAATPIRNFCKLGVRISRSRRSREKKTLEACLPLAKPKTRRTAQAHQGNQEAVDLRGHSRALAGTLASVPTRD